MSTVSVVLARSVCTNAFKGDFMRGKNRYN